jgi:UPF0716 protein FxsA
MERMVRPLFFLFVVFPLLELWLLFKVGSLIGALPTLGLVVLSGALGAAVLRQAGWRTLLRLQRGETPAPELAEGFLLALGGVLLLLPGLIGDVLGLLCLLPLCRHRLARRMLGRRRAHAPGDAAEGPVTLEGEYHRED